MSTARISVRPPNLRRDIILSGGAGSGGALSASPSDRKNIKSTYI
ncbi:MAG: hypothetical protein V4591_11475 [Bdellovibrionota bacterium]